MPQLKRISTKHSSMCRNLIFILADIDHISWHFLD